MYLLTVFLTLCSKAAEQMKTVIAGQRAEAEQKAAEAEQIKDECERELAAVHRLFDWLVLLVVLELPDHRLNSVFLVVRVCMLVCMC